MLFDQIVYDKAFDTISDNSCGIHPLIMWWTEMG